MEDYEQQIIRTERGSFEVFIKGIGKPLCFTHLYQKFSSNGSVFANCLTTHYKVILVNLKDAGHSSKARNFSELSMEETVKDLEAIRTKLGLTKWSFAGHSTGGFLGLTYAINNPESLESLLLCSSAASNEFTKSENCIYNFKNGKHRKEVSKIFFTLMLPFASKTKREIASRKLIELSLYKPEKSDDYFKEQSQGQIIKKRLRAYNKDLKTYDIRYKLKRIIIPTLILCGKHDVQCPIQYSMEIHSLIPGSKLVVFEDSNHFPFIEEKEAFLESINQFASVF